MQSERYEHDKPQYIVVYCASYAVRKLNRKKNAERGNVPKEKTISSGIREGRSQRFVASVMEEMYALNVCQLQCWIETASHFEA